MKLMTDSQARSTLCPLKMAGAKASPRGVRVSRSCEGARCQLWTNGPESEETGRCSFAISAMSLFLVPAAIGDSVFNAIGGAVATERSR